VDANANTLPGESVRAGAAGDTATYDNDVRTTVPGGPRQRLDGILEPVGLGHESMLTGRTEHASFLNRRTGQFELGERGRNCARVEPG
jgi:hypothetical protein